MPHSADAYRTALEPAVEESASLDRHIIHYISVGSTGLYEIAASAQAHLRTSTPGSWALRSRAIREATVRSARPRRCSAPVSPSGSARHADHDRGMSFGALRNVKEALGRAATEIGTSTTTGDAA